MNIKKIAIFILALMLVFSTNTFSFSVEDTESPKYATKHGLLSNVISQVTYSEEYTTEYYNTNTAVPALVPRSLSVRIMDVGADDYIYYDDEDKHVIVKINTNGEIFSEFSSEVSFDEGVLSAVDDLDVGSNGDIYVLDAQNKKTLMFDNDGNPINWYEELGTTAFDPFVVETIDGSILYYAIFSDNGDRKIQRYLITEGAETLDLEFGKFGYADDEFDVIRDIAIDSDGYFYIADTFNRKVAVFDSNGNFVRVIRNGFTNPMEVEIHNDMLFIADTGNKKIYEYDLDGNYRNSVSYPNFSGLGFTTDNKMIIYNEDTNQIEIYEAVDYDSFNYGSLTYSTIKLYWSEADDNVTAQNDLVYSVYYSSEHSLDTLEDIENYGVQYGESEANIGSKYITGLESNAEYFFNVVVEDLAGNKLAYNDLVQRTEERLYGVSFDSKGGSTVSDAEVGESTTIDEPTEPSYYGYNFDGWYIDEAYTTQWAFKTDVVITDTALYAKWSEIPVYNVTFDSNGGTEVVSISAFEGDTIEKPHDPVRTSYDFQNWFTDNTLITQWDFDNDTITTNTSLYALWYQQSNNVAGTGATVIPDEVGNYVDVTYGEENKIKVDYSLLMDQFAKELESDEEVVISNEVSDINTFVFDDWRNTTIHVKDDQMTQMVSNANEDFVIEFQEPVASDSFAGRVGGQIFDDIESKNGTLEFSMLDASYSLNARALDINSVINELEGDLTGEDVEVEVRLSKLSDDEITFVEDASNNENFQIMVPPMMFTVYVREQENTKNVKLITQFSDYVERRIEIPGNVDPNSVSTALVVTPTSPPQTNTVPTKIVEEDGKFYAVINSMTNSTYTLVNFEKSFKDIDGHWAEEAIQDLGNRMIITGTLDENFLPSNSISRGEAITIIIRALGLKGIEGDNEYYDVNEEDWFNEYINTAQSHDLIKGATNNMFNPKENISREDAMVLIDRMMHVVGIDFEMNEEEVEDELYTFSDNATISDYARMSVAKCIKGELVTGVSASDLAPKDEMTRGQVATIIQRILKQAELI